MKKWRLEDMAGDMEEDEVKEPPDEITVMENLLYLEFSSGAYKKIVMELVKSLEVSMKVSNVLKRKINMTNWIDM